MHNLQLRIQRAETVCVRCREFDLLNVSFDEEKHAVLGLVLFYEDSIDHTIPASPLLFIEGDFLEETNQLTELVCGQKTKARERGQVTRKLRVCESPNHSKRTLLVVLADCWNLDCGSICATRSKTEHNTTLHDRR